LVVANQRALEPIAISGNENILRMSDRAIAGRQGFKLGHYPPSFAGWIMVLGISRPLAAWYTPCPSPPGPR
jgi:hypothetical protein